MCFRPPSAEAGEIICPSCYVVAEPNPDDITEGLGFLKKK